MATRKRGHFVFTDSMGSETTATYVARERQIAQRAQILRGRLIAALGAPLSQRFGGSLVEFAEEGTLYSLEFDRVYWAKACRSLEHIRDRH